ncbi:2-oxoacid:ferredoxin oxidoreductase subunit beta [SCandidatus Aminicenantes bacterium Aminicenantia_JdfR_composite]|jgi:2-oxoglutarate ferredoxin oxidoreductase subunit beta|nr:2-oxoacid:ferredoxin oxidoreductase subunit beta [SCandidatus Aminicenantes bacterium Aminicenantia_JdfR_composite]MCP2620800.1 2-oxoacid:ferredoxin oxidoreductase subunit beta [Candidatus Aminicenantes bacterium AC-334-E05]
MRSINEFKLLKPTWCRGCGNYGILNALMKASAELDLEPHNIVIISGIGCSGRINNYFKCYGIHGTHGRPLPIASGVKIVNPRLTVIAVSGDGDAYSIGISHFIHSIRRNTDVLYLVVNNYVFALTRGQASPTSKFGFVSVSTPYGTKEYPIDGVRLALSVGGTYIARGFAGNIPQLVNLIKEGIKHKGFSFIDILSPCVVHNKSQDYEWYRKNIVNLDEDPSYDFNDINRAWERVNTSEKIPTGLIYRVERPSWEELILNGKREIVFTDLKINKNQYKSLLENFY